MNPFDEDALQPWGWDGSWSELWSAVGYDGEPARVMAVDRGSLVLQGAAGSGRGVVGASLASELVPTVGDWCAVTREADVWRVRACLPRRSALRRRAAGQATRGPDRAANVDTAVLVCGRDRDQGLRSLARLLTIVLDGGVAPVVVLNKIDQCSELADAVQSAMLAAPGFPVTAVSALNGQGLERLAPYLGAGATVALLGPSGAGKATLVNALIQTMGSEHPNTLPRAATGEVRSGDRRGRHTTTRRQLHLLPGGGLLVDTPGLRELSAWAEADGLAQTFADIHALAQGCRFGDCRHDSEPGCAVRAALMQGELGGERFHAFLELAEEAANLEARRTQRGRSEAKRQEKLLSKTIRRYYRERDGG